MQTPTIRDPNHVDQPLFLKAHLRKSAKAKRMGGAFLYDAALLGD